MNIKKLFMAFLVPLTFEACFEVEDVVPNAPSNEPAALSSSSSDDASSSSSLVGDSDAVYTGMKVYFLEPRRHFTVYQLNPVTLEDLYAVFYGSDYLDDGAGGEAFVVEGLSLKSPYVRVQCGGENGEYNIADLRDTDAVVVNKKTSFESARALYLMKSGMDFHDAKRQAGKEFLEAFGARDALCDKGELACMKDPDYESYMRFVDGFVDFSTEDTLVARFEKCGDFTCDEEALKKRYMKEVMDYVWLGVYGLVNEVEGRPYLGNFYAKLLGVGTCTAEKEGETYETLRSLRMYLPSVMSCRSGKWDFSYKEMDHTMGTMTDKRDGKTYKTVTYDLNGTTQTWMAEYLTYATGGLQVPCEDDSTHCGTYFIEDVLNVDSSLVYPSVDSCAKNLFSECTWCTDGTPEMFESSCETRQVRYESLKSVAVVESVVKEKGGYQGICPDGWRIPTYEDLDKLWDYLLELYKPVFSKSINVEDVNEKRTRVYDLLYSSSLGDPIGFGLKHFTAGFFAMDGYMPRAVLNYESGFGEYTQISAFVRCIKQ